VRTVKDEFLFDDFQQALMWALADEIQTGLSQARLPDGLVQALTKHLVGRIAALLDGRKGLATDGCSAIANVSFLLSPEELLIAGGPAWLSQHVAGTVEALLQEKFAAR
jgi:hypothetical protein